MGILTSPLTVGVVGAGEFARVHANVIARREDLRLVAVASRTKEGAEAAARDLKAEPLSLHGLCESRGIDVVLVASPHALHADHAVEALQSGKHVFVEKPLAMDLASSQRVLDAAEAAPGVCFVGHPMRFAPSYAEARRLIEDGRLGDVVEILSESCINWAAASRRDWHRDASEGGGMWLTQGVHVLDRVVWLAGALPTSVVGTAEVRFHDALAHTADDFGWARIDCAGITGSIRVIGHEGQLRTRIGTTVVGTKGELDVSHHGALTLRTTELEERLRDNVDGWQFAMLDAEWSSFLTAVRSGASELDAAYGLRIVETVEGIRMSRGERVVGLTGDEQ